MSHIDEGRLHAYVDGECRPHELETIERHLAVCQDCRARAEEIRDGIAEATRLLGHLEPGPLQPPPWREIEERAAARRRAGAGRPRRRVPAGLAWAASIMIAFGAGWIAHSGGADPGLPGAVSGRFERADVVADREEIGGAAGESDSPALEMPATAAPATTRVPEPRAPETREREAAGAGRDAESAETGAESRQSAAAAETAESGERSRTEEERRMEQERKDRLTRRAAAVDRDEADAERPGGDTVQFRDDPVRIREALDSELRRIRGERRLAADAEAREDITAIPSAGQAARPEEMRVEELRVVGPEPTRFFRVTADEASTWLGGPLRRLPDLELVTIEVGPGGSVVGTASGPPAVRLLYMDHEGAEITLIQQILPEGAELAADETRLRVHPSGTRTYLWSADGYRFTLTAALDADSLRTLAERVR